MNIRRIIREEIEKPFLEESNIPLRLIQAGAMENPPNKLYNGSPYKLDLQSINMYKYRQEGKGLHGSKGDCVGMYFFEEPGWYKKKEIPFLKGAFTSNIRNSTTLHYALSGEGRLRNKKIYSGELENYGQVQPVYIYEAVIKDDAVIYDAELPVPMCMNPKDMEKYVRDSKVKYKEFDGTALGEVLIWNKDIISDFKVHAIGIPNPYYNQSPTAMAGYSPLEYSTYIWFHDIDKANKFIKNTEKDKWGYLKSLIRSK
jgi:hypothetical protein